jgi:hypothetical protein
MLSIGSEIIAETLSKCDGRTSAIRAAKATYLEDEANSILEGRQVTR